MCVLELNECLGLRPPIAIVSYAFVDELRGFLRAETRVLNGTAGDNVTAGGTLNQKVLGFLVG